MKIKKDKIQLMVDVDITYESGNRGDRAEAIKAAKEIRVDIIGTSVKHGPYSAKSKRVIFIGDAPVKSKPGKDGA